MLQTLMTQTRKYWAIYSDVYWSLHLQFEKWIELLSLTKETFVA